MVTYKATWPSGFEVVWRNLTWAEYTKIMAENPASSCDDDMARYMAVYRLCRIEGPVPESVLAGIAAWIGSQQLKNSPFGGQFADISRSLQLARAAVQGNYLLAVKGFIAKTFNLSFSEIEALDADTLFVRLAQAEIATGRTFSAEDPTHKAEAPQRKLSRRELATKRTLESQEKEFPSVETESQVVYTRRPNTVSR